VRSEAVSPSWLYTSPVEVVQCTFPYEVPDALSRIESLVRNGLYAAGYVSYEAGYGFARERFKSECQLDWTDETGYPLLWMGLYRGREKCSEADVSAFLEAQTGPTRPIPTFLPDTDGPQFHKRISAIRELIYEGDIYQLNHTIRFRCAWEGDAQDSLFLYRFMREMQPVGYGAFINLGETQILSASPELFFSVAGDEIEARPMKGTAPRGETAILDSMLRRWLELDEKNRSENVMILDLLRNDLSRICRPGTVRADPICEIESYRTLFQMTAPVRGRLAHDIALPELFRALFPSGSITGAPKIRTMRRIRELEQHARGVYCGTIGHVAPTGEMTFNVAIRTLALVKGEGVYGAGGGIVWDSEAEDEYREVVLKAAFLKAGEPGAPRPDTGAIRLIETMRFDGKIDLLEMHLNRLQQSANGLSFSFDRPRVHEAILQHVSTLDAKIVFKVRLLLFVDGRFEISSTPLDSDESERPLRIGISDVRVHSEDPFLGHKTTFRPAYDRATREREARALDEVVLLNEREEITDGTIHNIFLRKGGDWFTPALTCGCLPGIARATELASGKRPRETALTIRDLEEADEIVLTNAVRGRRQGVLVPHSTN